MQIFTHKTPFTLMKHLIFLMLSLGLITACTDPQVIGLEVQPESDRITISSLDQATPFNLSTKSLDSIRTDEPLLALLGYFESSNFKDAQASFSTQLLLSQNSVDFGTSPILDSAILTFSYAGYYGDTTQVLTIHIEQLDQPIYYDSTYYSNQIITASPFTTPIEYSFEPTPNTTVISQGDTVGQRSISFNVDAIGQLILEAGTSNLVDNDAFLEYFKGIQVSVADNPSSASILYFNLKDGGSKLSLYYNDSLSYDMLIGSAASRINHFDLQNDIDSETLLGVQSMGGVELELSFNNLDSIKQQLENKVVNQALLSFTVENTTDLEPAHAALSLVRLDENGKKFFIEDITEGQAHFGGNLEDNKYVFNVSKYMLNLLNGEFLDSTLVLVPSGESVNANRTELNQTVELNIIYTEF